MMVTSIAFLFMLHDVLTLVLIVRAGDVLAAQQFLRVLTYKAKPEGYPPTMDYAKVVLVRGAMLALPGGRGKEWLEGVFG